MCTENFVHTHLCACFVWIYLDADDDGSISLHSVITRLSFSNQYNPTVILLNDVGEYITNEFFAEPITYLMTITTQDEHNNTQFPQ